MARLYTKKVWLNDQTKLSAKNLNHIEKGIEAVAEAVDELEAQGNVHTYYYEYDLTKFNDIMTVADNGAMVGSITEESNIVSELMKVANNCGVLKCNIGGGIVALQYNQTISIDNKGYFVGYTVNTLTNSTNTISDCINIIGYVLLVVNFTNNKVTLSIKGSGGSTASVEAAGSRAIVDPTQTYSRLYFNTKLTNEEIMALMDTLELTYGGMGNMLYLTTYSGEMDGILAGVMADTGTYVLMRMLTNEILFAINGNVIDETITFTGWNPNIDFSNGIEISGETVGTELPIDGGSIPIGANNDKIVDLFSSEPIIKPVNKGLSGVYDGNNLEVGSRHIDVSSLLDENKLPLNIYVVDDNLVPKNIVEGVNILGVEGTYTANDIEDGLITRTLTTYTNNRIEIIESYVFQDYIKLTNVEFLNATDIGMYAFDDCIGLTSINFPRVQRINNYAFRNCTSLTNINFPNVTNLGIAAFDHCTGLTSINFPQAMGIGNSAFNSCARLTDIEFPNTTGIGNYAFSDCTGLTNIDFPGAIDIGNYAFSGCTGLTIAKFPMSANIGEYAFNACSNLTSAEFPNATKIRMYAFNKCTSLTNIDCPNVTNIADRVFYNCNSLTNINFPLTTYVGNSAFNYCRSLTNIDFPNATVIGSSAFDYCYNLTNAEVPNMTTMANDAFGNCYSLIKIFISQTDKVCTIGGTSDPLLGCYHIQGTTNATYNPEGLKDGYIYVPASLLSQYKVTRGWSTVASQIIGHEDLEVGATLPNYTTDSFTTQTWYSDERLTTVVTEVATTGKYYCRLEA